MVRASTRPIMLYRTPKSYGRSPQRRCSRFEPKYTHKTSDCNDLQAVQPGSSEGARYRLGARVPDRTPKGAHAWLLVSDRTLGVLE